MAVAFLHQPGTRDSTLLDGGQSPSSRGGGFATCFIRCYAVARSCSTFGAGMLTRNRDPRPRWLWTPIVPPSRSTSRFTMYRPSPTPPKRRVEEPSAWRNMTKMTGRSDAAMPMPLSRTSSVRSPFAEVALTSTVPAGVNLSALPTRFLRIVFSLTASVGTGRTPSSFRQRSTTPSATIASSSRPSSLKSASTFTRPTATSSRPLSNRPRSSVALIRSSSSSALRRMRTSVSSWPPASGPKAPSARRSVYPVMTFSGVRSSCDMVATNSDLSRLADWRSAIRRAFSNATAVACAMPSASRRSFGDIGPVRVRQPQDLTGPERRDDGQAARRKLELRELRSHLRVPAGVRRQAERLAASVPDERAAPVAADRLDGEAAHALEQGRLIELGVDRLADVHQRLGDLRLFALLIRRADEQLGAREG